MEIRGIGIIHVPSVFGVTAVREEKRLDLVITFKHMDEVNGELDRAGEDRLVCDILGVKVAEVVIPVSAGRDLVNLVETAAQQHKLRSAGYDAARELDEQLKRRALA
jgi:HPr kinase/phosphorylase